ncbi:MAG TPA: hypothetical protein VIK77_04770 [Tissierellaceae bacterium]
MIRLKEIILERLEGEPAKAVVHTFAGADSVLYHWSLTAPETGYDKVKVLLKYENGDVLKFRYDLRKNNNPLLSEFIMDQLKFLANAEKTECYQEFRGIYTDENIQAAKEILSDYQLKDDLFATC